MVYNLLYIILGKRNQRSSFASREASLWVEKWHHQGDFVSMGHSKLVIVNSDAFAEAVAKHEDVDLRMDFHGFSSMFTVFLTIFIDFSRFLNVL